MSEKADRAKELLENPVFKQALQDVENAIVNGWKLTPPTDHEKKEEWHRRLFTLESVKANLVQAIEDGRLEDYREQESEKPGFLGDLVKWQRTSIR